MASVQAQPATAVVGQPPLPISVSVITLNEERNLSRCLDSVRELVSLIEKADGKKAQIKLAPVQTGDVPITYDGISKVRRLLSYNPQVKTEDGIPRFVPWFRAQQ